MNESNTAKESEELLPATEEAAADPRRTLPEITAKNIAALRTSRKLTQLELGEALSYSDKAISKWERGEAVPDAYVLLELSRIFGVSVDWILSSHDGEEAPPPPRDAKSTRRLGITLLSFFGVFAAATVAFAILATFGLFLWQLFIYVLPAALIVLIVFNSLWGQRHRNYLLSALLLFSILLALYIGFLERNLWPLFLLAAPGSVIVAISHLLTKKK